MVVFFLYIYLRYYQLCWWCWNIVKYRSWHNAVSYLFCASSVCCYGTVLNRICTNAYGHSTDLLYAIDKHLFFSISPVPLLWFILQSSWFIWQVTSTFYSVWLLNEAHKLTFLHYYIPGPPHWVIYAVTFLQKKLVLACGDSIAVKCNLVSFVS